MIFKTQMGYLNFINSYCTAKAKQYYVLLLCVVSFSVIQISCIKEIEVDYPEFIPKPVVCCLFTDSQVFIVNITKPQHILDAGQVVFEDNATVVILENGLIFDTLKLNNNGQYQSELVPSSGNEYTLLITMANGEILRASDVLPNALNEFQVNFRDSLKKIDGEIWVSQAKINIDNTNLNNTYFEVKFEVLYIEPVIYKHFNDSDNIKTSNTFFINNADPVISSEGLPDYFPTLIFSNSLFSKPTHSITADYYRETSYTYNGEIIDYNYDLIVKFRTISQNYYKYKKQLIKHLNGHSHETQFWDVLGDPVSMISNIEGGYGIFAGYTQIEDTVYKYNQPDK